MSSTKPKHVMRFFKPKRVLLVDKHRPRASAIANTLQKEWDAEVVTASTSAEAEQAANDANKANSRFEIVFVSFDVGDYQRLLRELCPGVDATRLLVTDREEIKYPTNTPNGCRVVITHDVPAHDQGVIKTLHQFMGAPRPRLPSVKPKRLPQILENQVRWLDSMGDLSAGTEIIQQLVWQLDSTILEFQLLQIGQGFSGARVFRLAKVISENYERPRNLVLKLIPNLAHQSYKCRHELEHHAKIDESLNAFPIIHMPGLIAAPGRQPAECGGWLGVMYEWIGHPNLCVVDLENIAVDPEKCIADAREVTTRFDMTPAGLMTASLEEVFNVLEWWYQKNCQSARAVLWMPDNAPENKSLTFPPYCFTRWEKADILESICQMEQYGKSLFASNWKTYRQRVLRLIGYDNDQGLPKAITKPIPLLLSHVHGDLNANNILLELLNNSVQLIDFACYQTQGHLVQDCARLEVAIKLELMGRETNGPYGRDLNSEEFNHWCEAEKWLQSWPAKSNRDLAEMTISPSSRRMFELCVVVRRSAEETHNRLAETIKATPKPNFLLSYQAALLYHTVRAIRFASRPHLKRLFSIYSAGLLVEQLDRV